MKFEEYIRAQLLGGLEHIYAGYTTSSKRKDIWQGLAEQSGDCESLSWHAKERIVLELMPLIKELVIDVIDQYRFVTGDGFSWDMIVPTEERKTKHIILWQNGLNVAKERWEKIEKTEVIQKEETVK